MNQLAEATASHRDTAVDVVGGDRVAGAGPPHLVSDELDHERVAGGGLGGRSARLPRSRSSAVRPRPCGASASSTSSSESDLRSCRSARRRKVSTWSRQQVGHGRRQSRREPAANCRSSRIRCWLVRRDGRAAGRAHRRGPRRWCRSSPRSGAEEVEQRGDRSRRSTRLRVDVLPARAPTPPGKVTPLELAAWLRGLRRRSRASTRTRDARSSSAGVAVTEIRQPARQW